MKKTIFQAIITIGLFVGTWLVLAQIDWVMIFGIEQARDKTEQKLGDFFWEIVQKSENQNKDTFVISTLDSIVNKICLSNQIDRKLIKLHVLDKDEINAFALPNGHLIIYNGLIKHTDNQEELCGVICHEIAHIELSHVMKKLVKRAGLSVLISMTTGNGNSGQIQQSLELLSASAFDRSLEKEADFKAVDYMINAKINPNKFADFLYKISDKENPATKYLTWISSHPESKQRAEDIIEYGKDKKTEYEPVVTINSWNRLKTNLKQ